MRGTFVGENVECFTTDGATWGTGRVFAYCDAPTVDVEREDGTRFSWRHDLTRLAPQVEPMRYCTRCQLHSIFPEGDLCNLCRDADHAAALEREQIARWLEERITNGSRLAATVRDGGHWKEG